MSKSLVVIVDEEASKNPETYRWFNQAQGRRFQGYDLENPLGDKIRVKGQLAPSPALDMASAEYLYLELTYRCNFHCEHCGIQGDIDHASQIVDPNAKYITPQFVKALADALEEHPFHAVERNLFYGGGEPLISPEKFGNIHSALKKLEKTTHVIITNGCAFPLDFDRFMEMMDMIGRPYVFFTISAAHKAQYESLAKRKLEEEGYKIADYIPVYIEPGDAINEKITRIANYCSQLGIGFTALNLEDKKGKWKHIEDDLRKYILQKAVEVNIHRIPEDEKREPCSKAQELSIRANGDLYPYCTDIFNGHPKLGKIGLL